MIITNHFVLPEAYNVRAVCTPAHPQLRDLLVFTPEAPDSVSVVCYDSIARLDLCAKQPTVYTRLRFSPSTVATGCGLIACGGQNSELAIKSADPASTWCHQLTNTTNGAINNSIHIAPAPLNPATPRLYVSNNDETIKVYDVVGAVPDFRAAKRRRIKTLNVERWRSSDGERDQGPRANEQDHERRRGTSSDNEEGDTVEERGTYDTGGQCTLERINAATIPFNTAINHCSVSPDGRRLVAVGDTNEIHLYDCLMNGDYAHVHSFQASEDASFSTDWSATGDKFAVASQDGRVNVFDVRSMPPCGSGYHGSAPKSLAAIKSTQSGPAGAVRKIKFSGGSRVESELLAFTEIVDVPFSSSTTSLVSSPPVRHRPLPVSGSRPFIDQLWPREYSTQIRDPNQEISRRTSSLIDRISPQVPTERWTSTNASSEDYSVEVIEHATDDDDDDEMDEAEQAILDRLESSSSSLPTRTSSTGERRRRSNAFEEDCPPELAATISPSSVVRSTIPWSNYSRILPDPRARPHPTTTSMDSVAVDFPRTMLPPRVVRSDPILGGIRSTAPDGLMTTTTRNLSGYSPLPSFVSGGVPDWLGSRARTYEYRPDDDGLTFGSHTGYQPNSLYFPIDSTPSDLLGLDWDEQGTSLFVATEGRVWEWQVDTRARRSFGEYSFL
ncbi:hypothetical protein OIO90_002012 [Microbotryomycetes sp. JL221]|nr:hypothetical protein OIO90_002012 [Microbotryomycetes sp. JL221]